MSVWRPVSLSMDLRLVPDIVNITIMKQTAKRRAFNLRRAGLFATIVLAFFIVKLDTGKLPSPIRPPFVLAYATDMSRGGLLSSTNAARAAQGLGSLAADGQLNNSAQAKAQDMLNKDYWAHVSPDGTEPWYFFTQAGYSYSRASENLAYGFMSSQAVIDGWMNSASHRDNMLGQYNDVGFGIVNIPNYQSSGEQTLVVAHYGVRSASAPAPAPSAPVAASTPAAPAPPAQTPPVAPIDAQTPDTTTPATPVQDTAKPEAEARNTPAAATAAVPPVQTASAVRVSVLGMLQNASLSAVALLALTITGLSALGYAFTHRYAFRHALATGEHYVIAHPGMDAVAVAAITTLILTTTYGTIG